MPLNASIHIETVLREGRTVLQTSYCTQPFKIANITEDRQQKALSLMLMSASPGILDGDCYDMRIVVGDGSHLTLETQSYQRLFQMKKGARQTITVYLEKGSFFQYLPHPLVPHQHAFFHSKTTVVLSGSCTLLLGEVISCGRSRNGEVFRFTSVHSITEIFFKEKMVVKENLLLVPHQMNLAGIGQLEGFTHQSTLLYLDEGANIPSLIEPLSAMLALQDNTSFGISALPVNGLVVRMLGYKAEQLFQLQKQVARLLSASPVHSNFTAHVI